MRTPSRKPYEFTLKCCLKNCFSTFLVSVDCFEIITGLQLVSVAAKAGTKMPVLSLDVSGSRMGALFF